MSTPPYVWVSELERARMRRAQLISRYGYAAVFRRPQPSDPNPFPRFKLWRWGRHA